MHDEANIYLKLTDFIIQDWAIVKSRQEIWLNMHDQERRIYFILSQAQLTIRV